MVIKCPKCGNLPSQGTNYSKLLALAEAGKLICHCLDCDISWEPSPTNQKIIAANIRKLMAENKP
jgi:hypothetical protein